MSTDRNVHLADPMPAIETRIQTLCPLVRETGVSQATAYEDLAALATRRYTLPAAIVVLGPIDYDEDTPALPKRDINPGILIIGEYDAGNRAGAIEFWKVIDQLADAFVPSTARSEDTAFPVAVLGEQDPWAERGVWLVPAGYRPLVKLKSRCAGVFSLIAIDPVKEWSD